MDSADLEKDAGINISRRLAKSWQLVWNQRTATKRLPKGCKRYEKGFCKFGDGCAYNNQDKSTLMAGNNNVEINKKVEILEKMVQEMA